MADKKKKVSDENFDTEDIVEETASDDEEVKKEGQKQAEESNDNVDTSQEESDNTSDDENASEKEKKPLKKKKNKHQEIIDELNDKVMRQMAEFENFRKRSEKEKSQMYDMGVKNVLEKMLPIVDNFERGLESAEEGDAFCDGMKMIYKQLMTSFEDIGVKEIEAEGEEFNPDYHNAVMHIDDEELSENVVVEVLQKGYMYNDTVLRHAMVKVAN